jgi:enterobactin synthetase component D
MIENCLQALRLLIHDAGFGIATVADYQQLPLDPDEVSVTESMLPIRRRDFWLGRSAARRAITDLGGPAGPVVMNHRRPVFPSGLIGSISHSAGVAVAIVASTARARSLGIDLELNPLPESAAALVLSAEELHALSPGKRSCAEAFSAKEAAFKALDPLCQWGARPLRQLHLQPNDGGFEVWLPSLPQVRAQVSVHHLAKGILAWTAII